MMENRIYYKYKIKIKHDVFGYIDLMPYLRVGEFTSLTKQEFEDLRNGLSVDRVDYSLTDYYVDMYIREKVTVESEIL